ncbi:MAG: leucine-rich repeat protein, partial [Treponema sp.]|nr:leucine-rich repeat protein [Treponema sp.]
TDLKSLTPDWITYNGADISPGPYAARNFVTPVTYTVVAADGSEAVWTVIVSLQPLNDTGDIGTYLTAAASAYDGDAADPIPLPVAIDLASDWTDLLDAIETAGEYVALDLSSSTVTGTEFDPGTASGGEDKIVSLVLPDGAEEIKAGTGNPASSVTFKDFTALTSVEGAGIETVGSLAFAACTSLETVNLPAVKTLGAEAFLRCTGLTAVSLPASLTTVGSGSPFPHCINLTSITVDPANPSFKHSADKKMLLSKDGKTLYAYPSATGDLSADSTLAGITVVGSSAFEGCTGLTAVNFPAAVSIDLEAFLVCSSLETVSLPAATFIGNAAFSYTGTGSLTLTLGSTPPALRTNMFSGINSPKTVTVKVPSGATAWDSIVSGSPYSGSDTTDNWGNAFRGKGWNGANYLSGGVNGNITLTIEELP